MKMFIDEVSKFSKKSWFVYVIFVILLIITRYTDGDDLGRVILVIVIHFVADIFIMIMFSAYARREYQTATFFQITSTLIFLALKIYTGFVNGEWVYLVADIVFILAAIKTYQFNVKQRLIKWINIQTMTVLSLILFMLIFCIEKNTETTIVSGFQNIMLTIGLFPFAISLSILQNEKLRIKSFYSKIKKESVIRILDDLHLFLLRFSYVLIIIAWRPTDISGCKYKLVALR